jgi:hypothetical protein
MSETHRIEDLIAMFDKHEGLKHQFCPQNGAANPKNQFYF